MLQAFRTISASVSSMEALRSGGHLGEHYDITFTTTVAGSRNKASTPPAAAQIVAHLHELREELAASRWRSPRTSRIPAHNAPNLGSERAAFFSCNALTKSPKAAATLFGEYLDLVQIKATAGTP